MKLKLIQIQLLNLQEFLDFEIDFQRDIRKNDYFKIVYEKYFDENGEFIKSGSILYAHMSVMVEKLHFTNLEMIKIMVILI